MQKEIHTLIIWSEASSKKNEIEKQIVERFRILKEYICNWSPDAFVKNLMSFYAHSQKERSFDEFKAIIENKIKHCGNSEFYLYVLEDENPIYAYRKTSNGEKKINANIFDLKTQLRTITDGGHKIHASDTSFESNKDLTILLGKNTADFLRSEDSTTTKGILNRNCTGTDGFNSIDQFFYLLNNSIDYVVMRNFECLPDSYTLEGHGDIDLLVEDLNYIRYLTHAKPVFPEFDYRVHYTINIDKEEVPFDFRYLGDNYYDINWQNEILKDTQLFNAIVKVPNDVNHFYSLLYHAYVQKRKIKDDYFPKLEELANMIGVAYKRDLSIQQVKIMLDNFLNTHHYRYTVPNDSSVVFNYSFSKDDQAKVNYGERLSSLLVRHEQELYYSEVFLNQVEKKIFKVCSSYIGDNEKKYLDKLQASNKVPQVYKYQKDGENAVVEMEYLDGVLLSKLNENGMFWKKAVIPILINESLEILIHLVEQNIQHRDIKPDNLILVQTKKGLQLKIIDFGWAKDLNADNVITPNGLGAGFKYKEGQFSDVYSMRKTIALIYEGFPSIQEAICQLFSKVAIQPTTHQLRDLKKNIPLSYKLTWKERGKWWFKKQPKLDRALHAIYYKLRK